MEDFRANETSILWVG